MRFLPLRAEVFVFRTTIHTYLLAFRNRSDGYKNFSLRCIARTPFIAPVPKGEGSDCVRVESEKEWSIEQRHCTWHNNRPRTVVNTGRIRVDNRTRAFTISYQGTPSLHWSLAATLGSTELSAVFFPQNNQFVIDSSALLLDSGMRRAQQGSFQIAQDWIYASSDMETVTPPVVTTTPNPGWLDFQHENITPGVNSDSFWENQSESVKSSSEDIIRIWKLGWSSRSCIKVSHPVRSKAHCDTLTLLSVRCTSRNNNFALACSCRRTTQNRAERKNYQPIFRWLRIAETNVTSHRCKVQW